MSRIPICNIDKEHRRANDNLRLKTTTMDFRTIVDLPQPAFAIQPCERMLFVGSCFADRIGRRFQEEKFRAVVNPYGVMYNPVSIRHTVERFLQEDVAPEPVRTAFLTLGTNHVYVEKATGEVVDNCQKRPQRLFDEQQLSVEACAEELRQAVGLLRRRYPAVHVIITVSPIRYAKYGYHQSQLSKSTLLLAVDQLIREWSKPSAATCHNGLEQNQGHPGEVPAYFPAYEIVNDELRDYRFYQPDMLHPSDQAVEYIWQRFVETWLSPAALQFIEEWRSVKEALGHRPFHPESEAYKTFRTRTLEQARKLAKRYPGFEPEELLKESE